MRVVLGCSVGGNGHLVPLLGVARALRAIGAECVLVVPRSLASAAAETEFRVVAGEEPPPQAVEEIWARVRRGPRKAVAGLIDQELFADLATDAMMPAVETLYDDLEPDLAIRESCEYATSMTAHRRGVPQVQVGVSASRIDAGVLEDVAPSLDRRCPGVSDAIRAAPYLTGFPAPLDPSPWRDTRRYRASPAPVQPLPDWWPGLADLPLVYVTFGSVLGGLPEAASVYRTALDAVADLPIRVLLTVGRAFDPERLGPVAPSIRVERWVTQENVLAAADLVVCHGGSGTTNAVLAAGLPLVVCPLFADQLRNAGTVESIGAGIVVRPSRGQGGGVASLGPEDVATLAEAIANALGDPALRTESSRVAAAIAGTPTLEEIVQSLGPPR